ncbi:autophagy protein 13 [Coemansia erecta]|uniref:Autophagy-related protein 13 n=1 Tax=Coemansia erecta TaxID=147472 RepID=A0A9W8CQT9_9FUNG|nr:autophagy protein 13 [Coemansia erecta]
MQPRLPRNSGSPAAAAPASSSFSSHYSSSPSPSPSINPFAAGALRSVHQAAGSALAGSSPPGPAATAAAAAHAFRGMSEATAVAAGGRARGATVSTMPANIRRSEGSRQQQQQQQAQTPQQRPLARSSSVSAAGKDARCEQIVQSFYSKAAQVVGQLRGGAALGSRQLGRSSGYGSGPGASDWAMNASSTCSSVQDGRRRSNRWFNLCLDDQADIRDSVSAWRQAVAAPHPAPLPMFIDVCLDVSHVTEAELLQLTDIYGRAWTVDLDSATAGRASAIVVETWRLDLDAGLAEAVDLPRVYKQAIVFFRSLYAFASLLPATQLARHVAQRSDGGLGMFCAFRADVHQRAGTLALDAGLTGTDKFLESHVFAPVATPLGAFAMGVQYRRECVFAVARAHGGEEVDAYEGLGAVLDEAYFAPTLSPRSQGAHVTQQHPQHRQPPPQQRPQSLQRAVAVPSVNPFRARPLSLGESSSLPAMVAQMRGSSPGQSARRVSLGTRSVVASEPVTGAYADHHAGDAGSVLHRSVMLRRFGDALSPGEHSGQARAFDGGSVRSVSSSGGSAGSPGVAPFRSPSLSETPGGWRVRSSVAAAEPVPMPLPMRAESMDVGSAASSHSRGLASSFGNRRASVTRRRTSMLGGSGGSGAAAAAAPSSSLPRRATVAGDDDGGISEFIRMVDSRQPLRAAAGSLRAARRKEGPHLDRFHGALLEFTGLSQDVMGSVVLGRAAPGQQQQQAGVQSAAGFRTERPHVREAAAGRDAEREPQLPAPVSIPGGGRRGAGVRGRSQPATYGPLDASGFVPRLMTPQPHVAVVRSPPEAFSPPPVASPVSPVRPNFPPLSFIVPRARVEQAENGGGSRSRSRSRSRSGSGPAADDDLMFQMDGSLH